MTDKTPDWQSIEDAYSAPQKILEQLPSTTESREAQRNLEIARDLTYRARERVRDEEPE